MLSLDLDSTQFPNVEVRLKECVDLIHVSGYQSPLSSVVYYTALCAGAIQPDCMIADSALSQPIVDVTSVSNPHNPDGEILILYRVDDAIVSLADAVALVAGKLFVAGRPWLTREQSNAVEYPFQVSLRNALKILRDRTPKEHSIFAHVA